MRRYIRSALIFSIIIVALPVYAEEIVSAFDARIEIKKDSTIRVEERIQYDFGQNQRHGIFRTIPLVYTRNGGNFSFQIVDISVNDDRGTPYPFAISYPGKNIEIKIGDPDKVISGKHIYVVSYTVRRALTYFNDHDELYWNVTGNEWQVPIDRASARIIVPGRIDVSQISRACFIGVFGSKAPCGNVSYDTSSRTILFGQELPLALSEGLTIVAGLPKGVVNQPSLWREMLRFLLDNWILFLPLSVFFIMCGVWWKWGKDPKGRGTIIAEYDAPDGLMPIEVAAILKERLGVKHISAEIISLATRGYIKIIHEEERGILRSSTEYHFERLKEVDDVSPFDSLIFESLFGPRGHEQSKTVALSALKNTFYRDIPRIKEGVYESVVGKGYFAYNPEMIRKIFSTIGGIFIIIGIIFVSAFHSLWFFAAQPYFMLSMIVSGLIIMIGGVIMPRRTEKGVHAKEYIVGLKDYLQTAEKGRIQFHNAPEKKPELFDRLLPFAMVLGVESAWAAQFTGIYEEPPQWYSGPVGRPFNAYTLTHDLDSFQRSAHTILASSAGSGGSGFGGGGFSGGGGGGGGGGSW